MDLSNLRVALIQGFIVLIPTVGRSIRKSWFGLGNLRRIPSFLFLKENLLSKTLVLFNIASVPSIPSIAMTCPFLITTPCPALGLLKSLIMLLLFQSLITPIFPYFIF